MAGTVWPSPLANISFFDKGLETPGAFPTGWRSNGFNLKDILHFRDNLVFFTLQNGKLRAECAAEVHPDLKLPTSDSPLWFKRLVPWFQIGPSSF
jgi:hypothetical protein